jgi:hypothetical protein
MAKSRRCNCAITELRGITVTVHQFWPSPRSLWGEGANTFTPARKLRRRHAAVLRKNRGPRRPRRFAWGSGSMGSLARNGPGDEDPGHPGVACARILDSSACARAELDDVWDNKPKIGIKSSALCHPGPCPAQPDPGLHSAALHGPGMTMAPLPSRAQSRSSASQVPRPRTGETTLGETADEHAFLGRQLGPQPRPLPL